MKLVSVNNVVLLICWPILGIFFLTGCSTISLEDFTALQNTVIREQQRQRELVKRVDILARSQEASQGPQANMLADIDTIHHELRRLQGRLDEECMQKESSDAIIKIEQRLGCVESMLGLAPIAGQKSLITARPSPTPTSVPDLESDKTFKPDKISGTSPQNALTLFLLAQNLYKQKAYQASRSRLEEFLKRYPKDKRADEVQFMIGDSFYIEKKYEEAILIFNQLVKHQPESTFAPIALLKEAMSFADLGDKRTAKIVLGKLVKTYPNSNEAKQAEKLMVKITS